MSPPLRLDEPLPFDLAGRRWLALDAYQRFPVFSRPWLIRRTALFATGFGLFGGLVSLSAWVDGKPPFAALTAGLLVAGGATAVASAGPALATLVRHLGLQRRQEQRLVVGAIVAGVVIASQVDGWASARIEGTGLAERPSPPAETAAMVAVNLLVGLAFYGGLGGGLALRDYLAEPERLLAAARARELEALRARSAALDTELGLLQAQIEPHFLFNTLATLRSLIGSDPRRAETVLDALVDYLRATIPRLRGERLDSTLGQQLDACDRYLALMAARTGRLTHRVAIAPELRERPFPPLVLLSLVENAVKHGIEPKRGPGRVEVSAERAGGRIVIRVMDDGVGLAEGAGSGVGLENVRAQLEARFGPEARLGLASPAEGGFVATIVLPDPAG